MKIADQELLRAAWLTICWGSRVWSVCGPITIRRKFLRLRKPLFPASPRHWRCRAQALVATSQFDC